MPNPKAPETSIGRIAENLYLITLDMPFRLRHVNVVACVHDGGVALFDTGLDLGDTLSRLEDSLRVIGRSLQNIDRIFITHYHADHCGLAGRIKEISGAVIHMSEVGRQIIENQKDEKQVIDTMKSFYGEHGFTEKAVGGLVALRRYFNKATFPFQVDECLDFHREYAIGDTTFEAFPIPGHARDHVCFFFRKEGILLSGDHILPEVVTNLNPDLSCPEFRSLQAFLDSLTSIENLPITRVLPAHGAPFSNLKKRVEEIRGHHRERKGLIFDSVKKGPKTAFQVSKDVFGMALPGFDKFVAFNEAYAHLLELKHEGVAREFEKDGQIVYSID